MPLLIPPEQIPAIIKIRDLTDASAKELIKALGSSHFTPEPEEMAVRIARQVSSIPIDDLIPIVDVIYDLYYIREFAEVETSRFLSDLIESIQNSQKPGIGLTSDELRRVRDRFQKLLNIETLETLSKAVRLQRDGERLYCAAKILSDIRPVFAQDIKTAPEGAVVTHTLKLSYHEGGMHKQFFVVLDRHDLDQLKKTVDRAHTKGKTLSDVLKRAKLPDLGS